MSERVYVCEVDDLGPGEMTEVVLNRISIGVARDKDGTSFYAFRNQCPHQGAPFHRGRLWEPMQFSNVGEFELDSSSVCVRCPWHGWEFNPETGKSIDAPDRMKIRAYGVEISKGAVYVTV